MHCVLIVVFISVPLAVILSVLIYLKSGVSENTTM
jgi:hypothetical protein